MNRLIPDFSKDKAVNSLSWFAEICFRRLWNKADDFGRYYADELILKAELFPRKEIRTPDLCRALQECERAALLVQYTVDGEQYLQLRNFNQRVRASKSRFPEPPENIDSQMSDTCQTNDSQMSGGCPLEHEHEHEEEEKGGGKPPVSEIFNFVGNDFKDNPSFCEAWREWLEYRQQRRLAKWTASTLKTKARQFAEWGVEATIENIYHSIGNGYQGIFPKKKSAQKNELSWEYFATAYEFRWEDTLNLDISDDKERVLRVLKLKDIERVKREYPEDYKDIVERLNEDFSKLKKRVDAYLAKKK